MRVCDKLAGILIILTGIVLLYLWCLNPEFRTLYVGEPFVDANQFIPGKNFKEQGFIKLHFTADYAVGPEEYHPFYYTHNPPLSEIINGIYQRLGLVRIEWQRLVAILWTLLSFVFFYKMIKLLVGPREALFALIFLITNPYILYWGDNLFASHQLMFVFMSLYFFLKHIRCSSQRFLAAAWATFFCAAFSNYELILLIAFFAIGLKLFRLEKYPRRSLLFFLMAPFIAFCLRNILVIWAIGFQGWFRDLIEIFLHRTWAIETQFNEIYKELPIILWVPHPELPKNYLWLLYLRLENIYGYGWSMLFIALFFPSVRRFLLPAGEGKRLFLIICLFFIMGVAWYLLFPQQTSEHFHSHTMLLFFPFASLMWGVTLIGVWHNMKHKLLKIIGVIIVIGAVAGARIQNFIPPRPFPGIEALPKYKGKVFCTNAIPTLISYYTHMPAAFCGYDYQFRDLMEGHYYFFLRTDRLPTPRPEFFLSVYGWGKDELEQHFSLIEEGKDYSIYRLQQKSDMLTHDVVTTGESEGKE